MGIRSGLIGQAQLEKPYYFIFDRNEEFIRPFRDEWNRAREDAEACGGFSRWQLTEEVTEADMKNAPGIQAADTVAWSFNREIAAQQGADGKMWAHVLRQIVPTVGYEWNEESLTAIYGTAEKCEERRKEREAFDKAMDTLLQANPADVKAAMDEERQDRGLATG